MAGEKEQGAECGEMRCLRLAGARLYKALRPRQGDSSLSQKKGLIHCWWAWEMVLRYEKHDVFGRSEKFSVFERRVLGVSCQEMKGNRLKSNHQGPWGSGQEGKSNQQRF